MPELLDALQAQDLGYLRIVAGFWGLDLANQETKPAREELAHAIVTAGPLLDEVVAGLPEDARVALAALVTSGGQIPWAAFVRKFGAIREMGAGRRDREQPHLNPASASEALYYRALLARAFLDAGRGPQEFAYIPSELGSQLDHRQDALHSGRIEDAPPGRPAPRAEYAVVRAASDHVLDDATDYLATLRGKDAAPDDERLHALLQAAGMIRDSKPVPKRIGAFLEADRPAALAMLVEAWRIAETFDELRLVPSLEFEGDWRNPTRPTRSVLLRMIEHVPYGVWWSVPGLVEGIKSQSPDFQRPAGDYDSWFIRRRSDGAYLRGFASWDEVEGALIRYLVTDILHWLGMVDLGSATGSSEALSFRRTKPGSLAATPESARLKVRSDGMITATRNVPRAVRYQLGRFCESEKPEQGAYRYHITPGSLETARTHGLAVDQLLALLDRHADAGPPPSLRLALRRWEANGTEARTETAVVLRVKTPEVLERLRKSRAAKFVRESLGPTAAVIQGQAHSKVVAALIELGVLAEDAVVNDEHRPITQQSRGTAEGKRVTSISAATDPVAPRRSGRSAPVRVKKP